MNENIQEEVFLQDWNKRILNINFFQYNKLLKIKGCLSYIVENTF